MSAEMIPVESSNIESIGFDRNMNDLYINFKNGGEYVYYEVPYNEFVALKSANSVGKHFHEAIRDMYAYDRINEE